MEWLFGKSPVTRSPVSRVCIISASGEMLAKLRMPGTIGVIYDYKLLFSRLKGGTSIPRLEVPAIHLPTFSANNTLTVVKPVTRKRHSAPKIMSPTAFRFILDTMAEVNRIV